MASTYVYIIHKKPNNVPIKNHAPKTLYINYNMWKGHLAVRLSAFVFNGIGSLKRLHGKARNTNHGSYSFYHIDNTIQCLIIIFTNFMAANCKMFIRLIAFLMWYYSYSSCSWLIIMKREFNAFWAVFDWLITWLRFSPEWTMTNYTTIIRIVKQFKYRWCAMRMTLMENFLKSMWIQNACRWLYFIHNRKQ